MPDIRVLTTAELSADVLAELRRLLDAAFAGGFSDDDWEHALGGSHVLALDGEVIVAHAAVVARELHVAGRPFPVGYVEGVATARTRAREGLGSAVMVEATALVRRDFAMGALSTAVHGFYERIGWERWRGPTFVRAGSELFRTEDEDDGVMVLRIGPSAGVDLGAAIVCEARPGDDW